MDFDYYNFRETFNQELEKWDPAAMSDLFLKAGARYVVLVTKRHDGFCMWPTDTPNPNISDLFAKRDVVGELSSAVKERGHEIRGLLFFII